MGIAGIFECQTHTVRNTVQVFDTIKNAQIAEMARKYIIP
jgi:hypothetical protein